MTSFKSRVALALPAALLFLGGARLADVEAGGPRAGYFPKVTLRTQDDKEVRFYEDLIEGKIVLINFMYTKCDGL